MSKLRLITLVLAIIAFFSLIYFFINPESKGLTVFIIVVIIGLMVRVIRWLNRD